MGKIQLEGAQTYSKELTSLYALSGILDIPVPLLSQEIHHWSNDDVDGITTINRIKNHVSHHSGGAFKTFSAGTTSFHGTEFTLTKNLLVQDTKSAKLEEIHDVTNTHTITHEDGGWFSGDTTTQSWSSQSTSKGCVINANQGAVLEIVEDLFDITNEPITVTPLLSLTNPTVNCNKDFKLVLKNPRGKVMINLGTNYFSFASVTQEKGLLWQSQEVNKSASTTYSTPQINCEVDITSQETIIQQLEGEFKAYSLSNPLNQVRYDILKNKFESEYHCVEGPTPALAALVSLTVAVCTQGLGASLGTSLVAAPGYAVVGSSAAMWNAGVSALCAKTAVSFLSNQGDLGKVARDLSSASTIKSLLSSIATAGIAAELTGHLKLATKFDKMGVGQELIGRLKLAALREAVSVGCDSIITGVEVGDRLKNTLAHVVIDTGAGFAAGRIGQMYRGTPVNANVKGQFSSSSTSSSTPLPKIDYLTHKFLHGTLGAAIGYTMDPSTKGMLSGAAGAVLAEVIAEGLTQNPTTYLLQEGTKAKLEGNPIEGKKILQHYETTVERNKNLSKIITAAVACFSKLDVDIAHQSSSNALENNFVMAIPFAYEAAAIILPLLSLGLTAEKIIEILKTTDFSASGAFECASLDDMNHLDGATEGFDEAEKRPTILSTPIPEDYSGTFVEGFDYTEGHLGTFVEGFDSAEGLGDLNVLDNTLPGEGQNWIKLKGNQGWKNTEDGTYWKKDMLHKDHWDISNSKGKKVREVDFNGKEIWPNGPKNKNKK